MGMAKLFPIQPIVEYSTCTILMKKALLSFGDALMALTHLVPRVLKFSLLTESLTVRCWNLIYAQVMSICQGTR